MGSVIGYSTEEHTLEKAHSTDSGFDMKAYIPNGEMIVIEPGDYQLVNTGIRIRTTGLEGQIRPRSGLALNNGVTVLNSPGTIDDGFKGEIKVLLINHGKNSFTIKNGDRIAQIVFAIVELVLAFVMQNLNLTLDRNDKGFGSQGIMTLKRLIYFKFYVLALNK